MKRREGDRLSGSYTFLFPLSSMSRVKRGTSFENYHGLLRNGYLLKVSKLIMGSDMNKYRIGCDKPLSPLVTLLNNDGFSLTVRDS